MARWQGNADLRPVLPVGAGIARERETRTVGAAPRQREYRPLSQSRMARPLGVPAGNIPMLCRDGRGVQEEPIMWVLPVGALTGHRPPTAGETRDLRCSPRSRRRAGQRYPVAKPLR